MDFNPFSNIDINSCMHKELSPYKIDNEYFHYPNRYYRLYLKKLFQKNKISKTNDCSVPINEDGFLIDDEGNDTQVNIDIIEYEQRKTFYIDQWYPLMKDLSVTFPCFIIDLSERERKLLLKNKIQHSDLNDLKNKFLEIINSNHDIKWWFIKLNSVSPKNVHKSGKEHKFQSVDDMLQCIINSDRTLHFIKEDSDCKVILRPWLDLPEHMEFRCFIHKKKLRAISQYQCYTYYPEFQDLYVQMNIKNRIHEFYLSIREFLPYEDCVMDVIIWDDCSLPSHMDQKIYIIEFNDFGGETPCGSGLYNWILDYELLYHSSSPVIRFVEEESEMDRLGRKIDNNLIAE